MSTKNYTPDDAKRDHEQGKIAAYMDKHTNPHMPSALGVVADMFTFGGLSDPHASQRAAAWRAGHNDGMKEREGDDE